MKSEGEREREEGSWWRGEVMRDSLFFKQVSLN